MGLTFEVHALTALISGVISEADSVQLIEYNVIRFDALLTDSFDEHLIHALPRENPHTLENAAGNLTPYVIEEIENPTSSSAATHFSQPVQSDIQEETGDANSAHGYEQDGDVEMTSEQNSVEEQVDQTDFNEAHQNDPRLRDAEMTLEQRMARNHADKQRHNK